MKYLGTLLIIIGLICPVTCIVKSIRFDQECAGYLKQAADANTVELALDRIDKALEYIEQHDITHGYTSVVYRTEDENIGFWYDNIKACKEELQSCINSSQLEKTNVLIKVRESLTDAGEKGVDLTIPNGISRYPNNLLYGILNLISVLFVFLIGPGLIIFDD